MSEREYIVSMYCEDGGVKCEEIVRCKDCRGFTETMDGYECERFSGEYHRAEPNGFCAWASRKEVGE